MFSRVQRGHREVLRQLLMTNISHGALACHGHDDGVLTHATSQSDDAGVQHETVLWSNFLVNAPVIFSLLERRMLYYLTLIIKHRFTERNLGVPTSWKDLWFNMTDADLGKIGGRTNVLQTYEALSEIGKKFIPVAFVNCKGESVKGKVHLVDSFFYNEDTREYKVRMSPEAMPYLINLTKSFTAFDVRTAMMLSSKFCQKFYELCCQFSGDFRYVDKGEKKYKKNVVPISITDFRRIFNLDEEKDPRTGKVIRKKMYHNFAQMRRRVIEPAISELNDLFLIGASNVWFDCLEQRTGRKVTSLCLFVYTRENPKQGFPRPWQEGDEPLCPYESENIQQPTTKKKDACCLWKDLDLEQLERLLEMQLNKYLNKAETWYYLNYMKRSRRNYDAYLQVLQVITDKEQQKKFSSATAAYKRKSIMQYALQENLKEFGWSIPAPKSLNRKKSTSQARTENYLWR